MKRLMIFISVLIVSITLSGCDLLEQGQIDDLENLLCAEDPDNPLCDLDSLADLEEDVVMDIVESTLLKAKEKANKTKCSSLLAPGSTQLIEECAIDEGFFLPLDVEFFTPLTITNDGSVYVVTGVTDDPNEELIITMKVVLVEGVYYLENWTYTYRMIANDEILYEAVKMLAMNLIRDLQDSNITNEEFCSTYYDGIDNDCDGVRDDAMSGTENIEFRRLDDDSDGDGIYDVIVAVTNEGMVNEMVVAFEITKTETGHLKVLSLTPKGEDNDCDTIDEDCNFVTDGDEVVSHLEMFLSDYLSGVLSDDELLQKYGMSSFPLSFPSRVDLVDGHVTVLKLSGPVDSFFDIDVTFNYKGMEQTTSVKVKVNRIDMALVINDGVDDDCDNIDDDCNSFEDDPAVIIGLLETLFADYMNQELTDETMFTMYPYVNLPLSFPSRADLVDGHVTVLKLSGPTDSFFDISIEVTYMGMVEQFHLKVKVNRIDMALTVQDGVDDDCDLIDDDCNLVTFDDAILAVENYVTRHNGMSIISDTTCMSMVIDTQVQECSVQRDELRSKGITITGYDLFIEGGSYHVTFEYSSDIEMYSVKYMVVFHQSQYGVLLELHEQTSSEMEMLKEYVSTYLNQVRDVTLSVDEVCSTLTLESFEPCRALKTYTDTTRNHFEFVLYMDDLGNYILELEFFNQEGVSLGSVFYDVSLQKNSTGENVLYQSQTKENSNPLFEG